MSDECELPVIDCGTGQCCITHDGGNRGIKQALSTIPSDVYPRGGGLSFLGFQKELRFHDVHKEPFNPRNN